jgi:iron(III) transport system substrate-binding protein
MVATAIAGALLVPILGATPKAAEVNVYSYRQPFLIKPMLDTFTAQTGIKVKVVFARKGLVSRLKAEGRNSPADLIFTVDIGRLSDAVRAGVTQTVNTPQLEKSIPAAYRQPDGHWHGLTLRARIIYASKARVKPGTVKSYEDLADPRWRGRVCTRKGDHAYQVGLVAAMIARHGEANAEKWLRGLKANLARKPQGNDRAQVKAIMEGVCDLALGNHYYMGAMMRNPKQRKWAESAYIVFPNQASTGTHMNVSGMALTRSAPNKANAIRLMEFLASDAGQRLYAEKNYEYPVKDGVKRPALLESWGRFKMDRINLGKVANFRKAAIMLVNKVRYNN